MATPFEGPQQYTADTTSPPVASDAPSQHQDKAAQLSSLIASAGAQYVQKRYEAAAENYSKAVELQDELNGEMSVQNADLFYAYGRCLFQVAMSKSDVLGVKVAEEKPPEKATKRTKTEANGHQPGSSTGAATSTASVIGKLGEEVMERAVEEKDGMRSELKDGPNLENKPYFQFQGDENFDVSDEDADDVEAEATNGDGAAEDAPEPDDFAYAFEILDIARVLLLRKLDALRTGENSISTTQPQEERSIKERLSDIYDLQAEISLENERFADAVKDLRSALAIKQEFEPNESKYLAELHYKLALALEFAAITTHKDWNDRERAEEAGTDVQVDEAMREEAAKEMGIAIESCRLKIQIEEEKLNGSHGEAADALRKDISEVKSICDDMEQRLTDLRAPLQPATASEQADPALRGILGSILGESAAEQKARIEEATRNANDLTGLVKHKKKDKPEGERVTDGAVGAEAAGVNGDGNGKGKGKRKADDDGVRVVVGKRPRVEET